MPFPESVSEKMLIDCDRRCSICGKQFYQKIQLHHAIPSSKGGLDTYDNCIPLCPNHHAEVGGYDDEHPSGKKYKPRELKKLRDIIIQKVSKSRGNESYFSQSLLEQFHSYVDDYDSRMYFTFLKELEVTSVKSKEFMRLKKNEGYANLFPEKIYQDMIEKCYQQRFFDIINAAKKLGMLKAEYEQVVLTVLLRQVADDRWRDTLGLRMYQDCSSLFGLEQRHQKSFNLSAANMITSLNNGFKFEYPHNLAMELRENRLNDSMITE